MAVMRPNEKQDMDKRSDCRHKRTERAEHQGAIVKEVLHAAGRGQRW